MAECVIHETLLRAAARRASAPGSSTVGKNLCQVFHPSAWRYPKHSSVSTKNSWAALLLTQSRDLEGLDVSIAVTD